MCAEARAAPCGSCAAGLNSGRLPRLQCPPRGRPARRSSRAPGTSSRVGIRMTRIRFVSAALLAALVAASAPAFAEETLDGKVIFERCQQCHGEHGQGSRLALAPSIAGLPQWYVEAQLGFFRNGGRGDHPQDIPGLRMRPMSRTLVSDDQVKAVAAY